MGRKKNKWRRDKNGGSEQPRRRQWGDGGGSTAADGEDGSEAYTKTSGKSRKTRGSGKLRGQGQDNPVLGVEEAPDHQENGGKAPSEGSTGEEDSGTSERGTEAEASRAEPDRGQPQSASALDNEAGLSRVPSQEKARGSTTILRKQEEQIQAVDPDGAVGRRGMDEVGENKGGVKDQRSGILTARVREESPVDKPAVRLGPGFPLQGCDSTGDGTARHGAANSGTRVNSSPCSKGSLLPANGVVVVPALALGGRGRSNRGPPGGKSSHAVTAQVLLDNIPYSLAWAGGRKGRPLMRSVEDALSGWFCTQDAKGGCIEAEITAIQRATGSTKASLGRLTGELGVPGPVICALGLRFRGREWEDLLSKIDAARDFLDLEAESACSAALAAFGSEASAPRPTDEIPLDSFAVLARKEAARFELAELELRQALRAEASRIAPRACPSAARALFERLDPAATGAVAVSELSCLATRLLGLAPPDVDEHSPRSSRTYYTAEIGLSSVTSAAGAGTGTPRGTAALSRNGDRPRLKTGCLTPRIGNASCAMPCSRARRFHGVIERLARMATTTASSPPKNLEDSRNARGIVGHGEHIRLRQGIPGWVLTARGEEPRGRALALDENFVRHSSFSVETSTVRRDHEENGSRGHTFITLSTLCRFTEGKRFDGACSLEGFLRTLSRAGRSNAPLAEPDVVARQTCFIQDQAPFSAETRRLKMLPIEEGAWGMASMAQWGTRGVRRASSQFSHKAAAAAPTNASDFESVAAMPVGEKKISMLPQARWDAFGGMRNSARSGVGGGGGGERYPTSRSGGPALSCARGGDFLAQALSSFDDSDGSGTLSSTELVCAASQIAGPATPMRREWGHILTERFAKRAAKGGVGLGGDRASCTLGSTGPGRAGGKARGVRWLGEGVEGQANGRLDIDALVDYLRPKAFSLSVMTPFGLVELSVDDPCITLGGLREVVVKKMFWRQHNCQVRRSDRNNFTLSRYFGALPLETESAGQRRRLVLDVLRPGELIFVTNRPASRSRRETPRTPDFEYMMGARRRRGRVDRSGTTMRESNGTRRTGKGPSSAGLSRRRQTSSNAAARTATNDEGSPRRFSTPTPSGFSSPQPPQPVAEQAVSSPRPTSNTEKCSTNINRVQLPRWGLPTTATRESAASGRESSRSRKKPTTNSRSTPSAGAVDPARDGSGEVLRVEAGEKWDAPRSDPSPTEGRREEEAYASSLVFDWDVDQVEGWIGETLELECCREAFRARRVDGTSLAGLTHEKLVEDLGVKNVFHCRKVVLHLDRLLAETLGNSAHGLIPRSIPNWSNRDFLMWCWQDVGIRHRPTLALLRQAGIDGLVLLAMESDSWIHLAESSPSQSCIAPLESIRRAKEALVPLSRTGDARPLPGESSTPEHDEVDVSREIGKGGHGRDTDVKGITSISSAFEESGGAQTTLGGAE